MVSTRSHPTSFPPPSPTSNKSLSISSATMRRLPSPSIWSHTPSRLTLFWLLLSIPLVLWDAFYVLLRPYSMPGGSLHSPIWTPYALYGTVDYIYGWKAWNEKNGFTAAQTVMNLVETVMYVGYLAIVWKFADGVEGKGRGVPDWRGLGFWKEGVIVGGRWGAWAVLLGWAAAVLTVGKTLLYWLNEYYSEFANIGHNDLMSLLFLWIVPNGAWLLFPSYMIYVFGAEILEGLAIASGESSRSISARKDE